ncbi:hypothetical protein MXB_2946 [Myxobolus squamalis]|nr:hypothetical protein MXB_2946 [Myxobolus squamalis]
MPLHTWVGTFISLLLQGSVRFEPTKNTLDFLPLGTLNLKDINLS